MYFKLEGDVLTLSGERSEGYELYDKETIKRCGLVKHIEPLRSTGSVSEDVIKDVIGDESIAEQLTSIVLEGLGLSMDTADSLKALFSLPKLKVCYIPQINPNREDKSSVFNKELYIDILKLLQNNNTIETCYVGWRDNDDQHTSTYYADPKVREAAEQMSIKNVTLKCFTIAAVLCMRGDKYAQEIADIFKNSYILEKCEIGNNAATSAVESHFSEVRAVKTWGDGLGKMALMYAFHHISPVPLVELLRHLQEDYFGTAVYKKDSITDHNVQQALNFYKQDAKCAELIARLENPPKLQESAVSPQESGLSENVRKLQLESLYSEIHNASEAYLTKCTLALTQEAWEKKTGYTVIVIRDCPQVMANKLNVMDNIEDYIVKIGGESIEDYIIDSYAIN